MVNTDDIKNISILYVEDQADLRLLLSRLLSRHYQTILLAENGLQGLELYQQYHPDIVISDIQMPIMDGLSMVAKIKEINPKARVILMSAHSETDFLIKSIELGVNQYIIKPVDQQKLFQTINQCAHEIILEGEITKKNEALERSHQALIRREAELRQSLQQTIALKEIISTSEERFSQLAENTEDVFWIRTEKNILYVNTAFERVFEITPDQLRADPSVFHSCIHPEDRHIHEQYVKMFQQEKACMDVIIRILPASGETKWLWWRAFQISPGKKKEKRCVSIFTDISKHQENEHLKQSLELAKKSANMKQQVLSNMSHEMRTPLHGILAMTDFLLHTNLNAQQKEFAQTIKTSASHLHNIVNDTLELSQLEEGKLKLRPASFSMKELNDQLLKQFSPLAASKGLVLRSEFSSDVPDKIEADYKRILQILNNLLNNALKFTSSGYIRLNYQATRQDDGHYRILIQVEDTGIGISEADRPKVFSRFTQLDESDTRGFDGLGLGLVICRELLKLMGGKIDYTSQNGKGSIFFIAFPAQSASSIRQQPLEPGATGNQQLPAAKILYAEDKEVNQKIISLMLGNFGCTTHIAPNGEKALEMYARDTYDLVLMDIQMPIMDGFRALKALKKSYPQIAPVICITANAQDWEAPRFLEAGFDDFISKPVSSELMLNKLSYWLGKKSGDPKSGQESHPEVSKPIAPPPSLFPEELDQDILNDLIGQTHQNTEVLKELYKSYLDDANTLMEVIEQESQYPTPSDELKGAIHALKGLSGTLGVKFVYEISREIDLLIKQSLMSKALSLIKNLTQEYQKAATAIRIFFTFS